MKSGWQVLGWGLLLVLIGVLGIFPQTKYTNCLLFAIATQSERGGSIVFFPSKYGWWFHFAWTEDFITFVEWVPIDKKRKRRIPPLLYSGKIATYKLNEVH